MAQDIPAKRLTIYVGEADRWRGIPLYHAIVLEARKLGLAGATVCRGLEGYGAHSRIHTTRILDLSSDLPVRIEIIDDPEKIARILPFLEQAVQEGLVVTEDVRVHLARPSEALRETDA